ncbi:MAG: hypothetical protein ACTSX8_02735 [Alphaproteobacteria bacterium]
MAAVGIDVALVIASSYSKAELVIYFAVSAVINALIYHLRGAGKLRQCLGAVWFRVFACAVFSRSYAFYGACVVVWFSGWMHEEGFFHFPVRLQLSAVAERHVVHGLWFVLLFGVAVPTIARATGAHVFVLLGIATARELLALFLVDDLPKQFQEYLKRYVVVSIGIGIWELVAGSLGNSLSLEGDAWHMFVDTAAIGLGTLYLQAVDKGKIKFAKYVLLEVSALMMLTKALARAIFGVEALRAGPVLAAAIAGLALNLEGMFMLNTNSGNRGTFWHMFADFVGSILAILSAAATMVSPRLWFLDLFFAAIVALALAGIGVQHLRKICSDDSAS